LTGVARCDHCGHQFDVADNLAGGITNCIACGKATQVAGLRDPLWRMWQVGGALLVLASAYGFFWYSGPGAAALAAIVGGFILWLISRGF
jgi:hypothetical protein